MTITKKAFLGVGGLVMVTALATPANAGDWGFSFGFSSCADDFVVYERPVYFVSRPVYACPPPVVFVDRPICGPVFRPVCRPVCGPTVVARGCFTRPAYRAAWVSQPHFRPVARPVPFHRGGGVRVSVRGR